MRIRLLLPLLLATVAAGVGCSDDDGSGKRQRQSGNSAKPPAAALVKRLHEGGYVVALRHAATDSTATDMTGDLRDCSRQRNLNAEGRRQARAIGRAFRRLEIPVGRVLASPFCRTRDTARLAFGRLRPSRALLAGEFFGGGEAAKRQRSGLGRLLALPPRRGSNTVLVSHEAAIADATGVTVDEGEALIVAPGRGARGFRVVSTVEAGGWARATRP